MKVDKIGWEYVLFRIDVYFTEYILAVGIDEKGHKGIGLIFEEKRQKALEKDLAVNLLELILVKKVIRIQIFISKFKEEK